MPQCRLDMIQYPYNVGSWLMVEVVAKIRLTGLDIVQNPHSIGFWLLMEVVYHSATVPHTHTHTWPWRPPRYREHHQLWKPQYTYNTRGNMAMTGSSNSCRGAGPAEATEPPPHFQGGPGAASQVLAQVHIALVEG